MNYKSMIEQARSAGVASENVMWQSIERVDKALEILKEEHPDKYWKLLRKTHADLYGPHYNEEFAKYDVDQISYTDSDGHKKEGSYWSSSEIETATRGKTFPAGTTIWDKYVAYNVMYADLCKMYEDDVILEVAYLFFFDDDDAPAGKIWHYMCGMKMS